MGLQPTKIQGEEEDIGQLHWTSGLPKGEPVNCVCGMSWGKSKLGGHC